MGRPEYLFSDSIETVTLDGTDGNVLAFGYTPQTPNLRVRATTAAGIDGGEQDGADHDNVADTIVAHLTGGTTAVRAAVQQLERLFDHACRYQEPGVLPVYFKFRPDSAEGWYRSQVLSGRALYDKDALNSEWLGGSFTVTTIFTRRFYFENNTETELLLMASGDASPGATGGKTVTNHDDSGHHNWLQIAAGQVIGSLPPTCRLEMTNASGGTLGKLYVSHEVEIGAANLQAVYEGESATPLANNVDATSSNGNFNRLTWPGTAETDIATWTIAAAENTKIRGRWLRVLARFANTLAYTDLYLRLKLLSGTVVVWQGEKQVMSATNSLQEIGALPIPPRMGEGAVGPLSLVLQATRLGAGAINIASSTFATPIKITAATAHGLVTGNQVLIAGHLVNTAANGTWTITLVDATSFTLDTSVGIAVGAATGTATPVSRLDVDALTLLCMSGYRKFIALGSGLAVASAYVDDGINGYVYSLTGGVKALDVAGEGAQFKLSVDPTLIQRLRFVMQRADNSAPIADTLTVRCYYRDRRLTI